MTKAEVIATLEKERTKSFRVKLLDEQIEQLYSVILYPKGVMYSDMPRGGVPKDVYAETIASITDMQNERTQLVQCSNEFLKLTTGCLDPLEHLIIFSFYANAKSLQHISDKYKISSRHIQRIKAQAINKITKHSESLS